MKSIYSLLILLAFFTSCKKENNQPKQPDAFLTISITNNSTATLKNAYTVFTVSGGEYKNLSGDILNKEVKPGETIVIKRDNAFSDQLLCKLEGTFTKIECSNKDEFDMGINYNEGTGYSFLNLTGTNKGDKITIAIK